MQITSTIAQLRTTDLEASIRFYATKVGLTLEFRYQDFYAGIRAGGQVFHLKQADERDPSIGFVDQGEHFHLYFGTDDAAAAAATLRSNGVRFAKDLHETAWGTREFAIKDDQGHTLYFGEADQPAERKSIEKLRAVEINAFVPSKDFALSKQFYQDLGFVLASDSDGVACLHHGDASFLLQDFYAEGLAKNLMMHLLVKDVDAWWSRIRDVGIAAKYDVKVTNVERQPWRMRDFVVIDPSGVMWRIAEKI